MAQSGSENTPANASATLLDAGLSPDRSRPATDITPMMLQAAPKIVSINAEPAARRGGKQSCVVPPLSVICTPPIDLDAFTRPEFSLPSPRAPIYPFRCE